MSKHKDNRHIQTRLDYLFLFRNETKAKVIRIMETWTNQKRAEWYKATLDSKEQGTEPPEEELWVTMSYEQFSLFAFETIKHDTIKEAVDDLVESEYLGRRPHPDIPYGPPQYLLNIQMLQHLLTIQEIPILDGVGIIIPPRKKHNPQEKYPLGGGKDTRGEVGKIPPPRGENTHPSNNITKNTSKNHTKNKDTFSANALARTVPLKGVIFARATLKAEIQKEHIIPFAEAGKRITDARLPAVKPSSKSEKQQTTSSRPGSRDDAALVDPPAGDSSASSDGPRASGEKQPRGKKPRAEPEPVPKFDLTEQQQHFWSLWCGVWFNQDIPPDLTATAYGHVEKLAPHITTAEQVESLVKYARKCLEDSTGVKRKVVHLGNCVNSYSGWKQEQEKPPPRKADEQEVGITGYPKFKSTRGKEMYG